MLGVQSAPRAKVCGITSREDAEHAVEHGAWAIGMVLWPHSKRAVTLQQAADIAGPLRRQVELVGVFVNQTLDEVVAMCDSATLTVAQLHGDEGPSFCEAVARRAGVKVVKAGRIGAKADVQALDAFRNVDFHLLDAKVAGAAGGTGETFDWSLVLERQGSVPFILSGGLDPENVVAAIEATRPWGVDVASGTESAPGVKDHAKVEAFLAAVLSTGPQPEADDDPVSFEQDREGVA